MSRPEESSRKMAVFPPAIVIDAPDVVLKVSDWPVPLIKVHWPRGMGAMVIVLVAVSVPESSITSARLWASVRVALASLKVIEIASLHGPPRGMYRVPLQNHAPPWLKWKNAVELDGESDGFP